MTYGDPPNPLFTTIYDTLNTYNLDLLENTIIDYNVNYTINEADKNFMISDISNGIPELTLIKPYNYEQQMTFTLNNEESEKKDISNQIPSIRKEFYIVNNIEDIKVNKINTENKIRNHNWVLNFKE